MCVQGCDEFPLDELKRDSFLKKNRFTASAIAVSKTFQISEVRTIEDLRLIKAEPNQLWIDFESSTVEDILVIAEIFGLHPVTAEDCIGTDNDEKREYFILDDPLSNLQAMTSSSSPADTSQQQQQSLDDPLANLKVMTSSSSSSPAPTDPSSCPQQREHKIGSRRSTRDLTNRPSVVADYAFLAIRALNCGGDSELLTIPVNLVIFTDVVLSFHPMPMESLMEVVRRRLGRMAAHNKSALSAGAEWVAYTIIDAIAHQFLPFVCSRMHEVESLDDLVLELGLDNQSEFLIRTKNIRRSLNSLKHILNPKSEMLAALAFRDSVPVRLLSPELRIYLRDVYDHVQAMREDVIQSLDNLSSIQSTFLSRCSVESALDMTKTLRILKITGFAPAVFLPMTFLTALFSMNIDLPGQTSGPEQSAASYGPFWGIVALCVTFPFMVIAWSKYFKWI